MITYTVYKISLSIEPSNMAVTENTISKYGQTTQENVAVLCLVAQSCPTLCDPMDCGPSGSSIPRDSPGKNTGVGCRALLQRSSQPRDGTQMSRIADGSFTV